MTTKEETQIKLPEKALDYLIDEKFAEIFFLAKEEYRIENNTDEERLLYEFLEKAKKKLKQKCNDHFCSDTEKN